MCMLDWQTQVFWWASDSKIGIWPPKHPNPRWTKKTIKKTVQCANFRYILGHVYQCFCYYKYYCWHHNHHHWNKSLHEFLFFYFSSFIGRISVFFYLILIIPSFFSIAFWKVPSIFLLYGKKHAFFSSNREIFENLHSFSKIICLNFAVGIVLISHAQVFCACVCCCIHWPKSQKFWFFI